MKVAYFKRWSILLSFILFVPSLVSAHPGIGLAHGHSSGFFFGLVHPFSGLDHLLAMFAVGLWAVQLGGKRIWLIPATFVSVVMLGLFLGISGTAVPFAEQGIVTSVFLLGLFIATVARFPLVSSIAIVGLFALFHGYAHGTEILAEASGIGYGLGLVVATGLLHLSGIGLGLLLGKSSSRQLVRFAGVAIMIGGVLLYF